MNNKRQNGWDAWRSDMSKTILGLLVLLVFVMLLVSWKAVLIIAAIVVLYLFMRA